MKKSLLALVLLMIPFTTVLALTIQKDTSSVSELQEPTYSPTDEQVETAESTRNLKEQHAKTVMKEYLPLKEYTPEQIDVVIKILETFPDEPVMVRIAWCESHLISNADRANLGVDVGLFQINQVHLSELSRLGLDRRNIDDNIKFTKILYDQAGTKPWYMSSHCW